MFSILPIIKIAVLIILGFYIIFATVIIRQVGIMTKTLEVGFEAPLKAIALIHFLLAVGTFLVALIIL